MNKEQMFTYSFQDIKNFLQTSNGCDCNQASQSKEKDATPILAISRDQECPLQSITFLI